MMHRLLAIALLLPVPALAQAPSLQARAEAKLAEAPKGTRIGLVVADESGREIVSVLPDQRFIPASNTKMVTTAAAFATMGDLTKADVAGGTSVSLNRAGQSFEAVLTGYGDARMSAKPDCTVNCLATLADAVAAKTKAVTSVRADAQAFSDQRWSPGMSWNNIPTESGTAIAALSLDDNEVPFTVAPAAVNQLPVITFGPQNGGVDPTDPTSTPLRDTFFTITNSASTMAAGMTKLGYDRLPFRRQLSLTGTIVSSARPEAFRLGIDDPAYFTAWTFARMLRARGVRVGTQIGTNYARAVPETVFPPRGTAPNTIARLVPPPLADDIVIINKVSQNLHAELLLRRIGCAQGDCSAEGGLKIVRTTLELAGLPRAAYDFSDGSGMSTYNRISPRGMIALLRWAQTQPWGKAWRNSFPVGGVDGTLAGRFKGTILEGRIFAKTGGLNATAALSGYMTAKSGRTLAFSILANDIPDGMSARPAMDATLVMIAESN